MPLTLPTRPITTAASISAQLSPAALALGESVIQEVIDAVEPKLATIAWQWYDTQNTAGFFGWAEHSLLGPIFTALFGANPGASA